jgi:hypothetical protein
MKTFFNEISHQAGSIAVSSILGVLEFTHILAHAKLLDKVMKNIF